tara:strand:- start:2699 stop:2956 length:258 start_codon:yes stop_codon:yes gene_type:complete
MKTSTLFINLSIPEGSKTGLVRRYLREFLFGERVINVNLIGKSFLVNGTIASLRAPKSARIYHEVFEDYGGEKIQLVPSLNSNDY